MLLLEYFHYRSQISRFFQYQTCTLYSTEPVGAKAPTLVSDTKWTGIERKYGHSVTLLCPAQGFPSPSFRLAKLPSQLKTIM